MAEELKKYDESRKFKYEELKGKDKCPTGVDPSRKEVKLSVCHILVLGFEAFFGCHKLTVALKQ